MKDVFTVRVRFFASYRERYRLSDEKVTVSEGCTVQQVWHQLLPDDGVPAHLLVALNDEYSQLDQTLSANDEIAFFPPVTGG